LLGWAWRTHLTLNRTRIGARDYSEFPIVWFQRHWSKATFPRRRSGDEFLVQIEFLKPRVIPTLLFVARKNPCMQNRQRSGHPESRARAAHKSYRQPYTS